MKSEVPVHLFVVKFVRSFLFLVFVAASQLGSGEDQKSDEDARRDLYRYLQGREVYQTQCLPCHGTRGKGDGPWSLDLKKDRPRNFRTGVFKFRTTPSGSLPTDEDLKRTIKKGVSGTSMPTFQNHLSDDEIEAVITYVKSFSRNWKDEKKHKEPIALPQVPDWLSKAGELETHRKSGQSLFANLCVSCHGKTGAGDGPVSHTLVDIWGHDIRPADLSARHHKSGDASTDLYRSIATGLDGTPMAGYHAVLTEEQIWDLVCYIKTLSPK